MSRRRDFHDHADERAPTQAPLIELPLFSRAPEIRAPAMPAPSRPVASSERGAQHVTNKRDGQWAKILSYLASLNPQCPASRDEIVTHTGLSVNACCGRLWELTGSFQVEAIEDGARSYAGNSVFGYRLTELGRQAARRSA